MKFFPLENSLRKLSLRTVLILPYVVLVLLLAIAIGVLSYSTGNKAVLTVSDQLLEETVYRIGQAVDRHVVGSMATLEAAFPEDMRASESIEPDFDIMRTRFWIATSLHIDPNNYVYYGNKAGQAIGLYRHSYERGELRIKFKAEDHRKRYRIDGINGVPLFDSLEEKYFDPRIRPWYLAGQNTTKDIWTSVYIDFGTLDLVATRARRVLDENGDFQGVVATDMPLRALNDFVSNLDISENGIAFIVETDGRLIASSCSDNVRDDSEGRKARVYAGESGNRLQEEIYERIKSYLGMDLELLGVQTMYFEDSAGEMIHLAFELFKDSAGLNWVNVVAMPDEDYLGGISDNVYRTLAIAVIATIIVIIIGLWILNWVTTDLKLLSLAVNKVGRGVIEEPIDIRRNDEIGDLAKSFQAMQYRLQTDHLTGLPNRYAMEQCLNSAVQRYREKEEDSRAFAILFVDINDFKNINDTYGHDVGDQVLIEFALRLRTHVRPNDVVCRYAGDEFVIMLQGVLSKEDLAQIKANIEKALSEPLKMQDSSMQLSGSLGEAHFPGDAENMNDLLIIADRQMYENKMRYKAEKGLAPPSGRTGRPG